MKTYEFTTIHTMESEDCPNRKNFCDTLQAEMGNGETIAQCLELSFETFFHSSGKVNRHNVRVWSTENQETLGHLRGLPKVSIYCVVSRTQVYVPFFFAENTPKGIICLYMLQNWLVP
jgi:hypothetical protein